MNLLALDINKSKKIYVFLVLFFKNFVFLADFMGVPPFLST
jgi:hypothetical protein